MARQKKPVHRVQMTEGKRNIIYQLLEEYDIQSAEDIQDALKDLLGGTIKERWKQKWMIISAMKNQSTQIMMIIAMVINVNRSTAGTALWKSKCRRIANQHSSHR